jgi:hypothetical protein
VKGKHVAMPIVKTRDYHRALVESLAAAQAETAKLKKGIQDYLDGNYGRRVRKYDRCPHGQYGYEICEACIDEHFTEVLNGQRQEGGTAGNAGGG